MSGLLFCVLVLGSLTLVITAAYFVLGFPLQQDSVKLSPFECGFTTKKSFHSIFSLKFFLVSLIFLIFDIELVLLFPYLLSLGLVSHASLEFFVFVVVFLISGFVWEWAKMNLEWVE